MDSIDDGIYSFSELKSEMLCRLVKYHYGALARNGRVNFTDVKKRLGYLWKEFKPRIKFVIKPDHYIILTSRAHQLSNLVPSTVVALDVPASVPYSTVTVEGNLDVLLMPRPGVLEAVWFSLDPSPPATEDDTVVRMKSQFFHNWLKRKAYRFADTIRVRYLHMATNTTFLVSVEDNRRLASLVKRVHGSMEHTYPRADKKTCSFCQFRRTCEWSTCV